MSTDAKELNINEASRRHEPPLILDQSSRVRVLVEEQSYRARRRGTNVYGSNHR